MMAKAAQRSTAERSKAQQKRSVDGFYESACAVPVRALRDKKNAKKGREDGIRKMQRCLPQFWSFGLPGWVFLVRFPSPKFDVTIFCATDLLPFLFS